MSLLLRLKPSPLKQLYPTLISSFSTTARLSAPKTREELLRELTLRNEKHSETAKTTPLKLFLSRFNGDKAAGRQNYGNLSAEEKKYYVLKAAEENRTRKETPQLKLLKALAADMPRKITNPYTLFVKENYTRKAEAMGERDFVTISKVLAQEWSSLPDPQKQRYREKIVDIGKQYEVNYNKWVETLSEDERALFGSKGQKYLTKAQRAALLNAPKQPYSNFLKEEFASVNMKGLNSATYRKVFADTVKEASRKWNALSQAERQAYSSVQ